VGIICTSDRETWAYVQARTGPSLYPVLEGISGWRRKELFGEEQEEGRGVEMKGFGSKGYELLKKKKKKGVGKWQENTDTGDTSWVPGYLKTCPQIAVADGDGQHRRLGYLGSRLVS
jgi:hypothetical protein